MTVAREVFMRLLSEGASLLIPRALGYLVFPQRGCGLSAALLNKARISCLKGYVNDLVCRAGRHRWHGEVT